MELLKAIPTEYRGVRYRSKSEAMFAYYLMHFESANSIQYEPDFAVSGWNPDFLISFVTQSKSFPKCVVDKCLSVNWSLPRLDLVYIEYKPSMPTATYLSRLASVCHEFMETAVPNSLYHSDVFSFRVYIGGFYNPARMLTYEFRQFFEYEYDDENGWLTDFQRKEILETRFDLVGA